MSPSYGNHNTAYYDWVCREVAGCPPVLDVGCGDGSLAQLLVADGVQVTGIDPAAACIERARTWVAKGTFACATLEDYDAPVQSFGSAVFVASLHHMDAHEALAKAKALIRPGGKIVVVGLAHPSSLLDWVIEVLRIVPTRIGSALHRMQSSEELGIPTSYELPTMAEVRRTAAEELPGAQVRPGLYYRYLLSWTKGA